MPRFRTFVLTVAVLLALPASAGALEFPDGDITREGFGDAGATVEWATPTFSAPDARLVGSPICDPRSGSDFPTGTTTVNCLGVLEICPVNPPGSLCHNGLIRASFTVTVTRGEGPALTGLADRSAHAPAGAASARVEFALPEASDPSGVEPDSVTCSPGSGSAFPLGETTVRCTARDVIGNESSGTFRVRVAQAPPASETPQAPAPGGPQAPGEPQAPAHPQAPAVPPVTAPAQARPVAIGRLRVRRGVASVRVKCPAANPVRCAGVLRLETADRRKRRVGGARFALAPGRGATVRVRLSRAARRVLARRGRLALRATARTADQAGRPLTGRRTFKVKAARRR